MKKEMAFYIFTTIAISLLLIDTYQDRMYTPTEAEIVSRLDKDIVYYPADAVKALQNSLKAEGYDIQVDGVLGAETLNAYNQWKGNK